MNLNKKIGVLLDNGFKPEFISSLNEAKINFLFEKISKRKEAKEAITKTNTTTYTITPDTAKTTGADIGNVNIKLDPTTNTIKATEIKEKFESKAQQGLFWARCNKCKTDDCKWCKMAKEFSKSTSKKQYETMPEKKHPEKTVKYKKKTTKKKNTNEEFTMANYFEKLASVNANNAMGKTIDSLTKEEFIKNHINKIVEDNLQPTMKKRDLLRLIESESKKRKNLNEDFYYGHMEEDFDMMSREEEDEEPNWYEEDDEEYEEYDMPPGKEEPGMPPGREDDDAPRPRHRMSQPGVAPTIDPGIAPTIDPDIDPGIKEPDVEPEWTPDEDEPIIPSPDVNPEPQARRRRNDIMERLKEEFNRNLNRLDNITHKPIKYKKY